jgi:hypothetical protein
VCEAAHVPVIWATQVLESLAKTGTPSRAEITDAAMGERAECVMLNKGPHLAQAVRVFDDILLPNGGAPEQKECAAASVAPVCDISFAISAQLKPSGGYRAQRRQLS